MLQLAISREYQQALQHRIQGVDRSLVHAFSVEPLPDRPGKEPPRRRKIDSPSEDSSGSIYLLQLLKNESASATTAHPTGADPLQSGSIEAPLLSGTGITPVIGEETFEALRLTQYESGSLEGALNASASGKAVNLFWRGRFTKE